MTIFKAFKKRTDVLRSFLKRPVVVTAAIPTMAVLVVGTVGIAQIQTNPLAFLAIFLVTAILVFLWEYTIVQEMQNIVYEQCDDLTTTCREFMLGNRERRAGVVGEGKLQTLAHTINRLLDQQQSVLQTHESEQDKNVRIVQEQNAALNRQLIWLTEALTPALHGDLRVRSNIEPGDAELLASMCNELIEKLALFTRWIRYMSAKVLATAYPLSDQSSQIAQTTEAQLHQLEEIVEKSDRMGEFIQSLQETLHLSLVAQHNINDEIQQHGPDQAGQDNSSHQLSKQLALALEKQTQRLKDCLTSLQITAHTQKSFSTDILTLAHTLHRSGIQFFEISEQVQFLMTHAERWQSLAGTVQLSHE
ncbi:MAG TPA: hypothetical protein VKX46_20435 [Ktedonobacteraceae bacterium]|nr:hypothetical protein [Ktedonobacteraceae bacterium]